MKKKNFVEKQEIEFIKTLTFKQLKKLNKEYDLEEVLGIAK